ncbi:hypothetical protein AB0F83_20605, partial [Micromonospora chalcea]|uniref:hypothetical protein n=1 Tax=Micromonospora chalcea TaxID=1874 RepID=UPI00340FFF40
MPPRSEDPRRDATGSRRGSSRGSEPREPGLGGISDARAYTPRGRTVREGGGAEQRRTPRSTRSGAVGLYSGMIGSAFQAFGAMAALPDAQLN